eukprot:Skav222820  [mRNA]  locus=scaffold1444:219611:226220:- [translate_table: standard]
MQAKRQRRLLHLVGLEFQYWIIKQVLLHFVQPPAPGIDSWVGWQRCSLCFSRDMTGNFFQSLFNWSLLIMTILRPCCRSLGLRFLC